VNSARFETTRYAKLAMILLIASFLLSGCAPPWGAHGYADVETCLQELAEPQPAVTGVFVQPDDGYTPVIDEIRAARCTLDLAVYMLTDDVVFDALISAEERGVAVRVILEEHPFGMFGDQQEAFDRLVDAGIDVQWGRAEFQFTHAKYMIVDQRTAVIMNQNLTGAAFSGNREFGVVTTGAAEVAQAQAIFDADWEQRDASHIDGPLFVSPDNARGRVIDLIDRATDSIDFYAEIIRDTEILDALERAVERGVRVRLIMNASLDPADEEAVALLVSGGVEVRLTNTLYIHSKAMIIDGDAALIGSINYSMTSLDRNREIAMRIQEPALVTRVAAVYERDWTRAVPVDSTLLTPLPARIDVPFNMFTRATNLH
jgi:cardiolipin synthase